MKQLILLSGGCKSTSLIPIALKEAKHHNDVELLFYDRAQPNYLRERKACQLIANHYELKLNELSIKEATSESPTLFKLTTMILSAMAFAYENKFTMVYYGASASDQGSEHSMSHLKAMQLLLRTIQPSYDRDGFLLVHTELEALWLELEQWQVIKFVNKWAVPWAYTWCCDIPATSEDGQRIHCGVCLGCRKRRAAFQQANLIDSTKYIQR